MGQRLKRRLGWRRATDRAAGSNELEKSPIEHPNDLSTCSNARARAAVGGGGLGGVPCRRGLADEPVGTRRESARPSRGSLCGVPGRRADPGTQALKPDNGETAESEPFDAGQ